MKKFFVSAGLVAVGAASLQTALAAGSDMVPAKFWNVSATLRGFYDDNYNIGVATKKGSFGVELSPSVSLNVPLQQTVFGLRYTYGAYYYQQREDSGMNAWDQTHQVDAWMDHKFNERWKLNVADTFAVGQEPELLASSPTAGTLPFRINGNNIANHGSVTVDTDWTRLFSTSFRYGNNLYDYENSGAVVADLFPGGAGASRAGVLNRIDQRVSLDFQWHLQLETMLFVGYSFSWVNYTADEPIALSPVTTSSFNGVYHSADRDSDTHYGYVGIQHQFTPNLTGQIRGGASYTDNYNDPLFATTTWSPYADLSLSYTYLPGSYLQVGFTHDNSATDVVQPDARGRMTQFSESSVVYASVNHRITQKLSGTLIGRLQNSTFEGGQFNSSTETGYGFGVNLAYQFNQHWSTEVGYNYDNLVSDIGRDYERNRVYLGVTAKY